MRNSSLLSEAEKRPSAAAPAPPPASPPVLVHDGESFRVYRHALPARDVEHVPLSHDVAGSGSSRSTREAAGGSIAERRGTAGTAGSRAESITTAGTTGGDSLGADADAASAFVDVAVKACNPETEWSSAVFLRNEYNVSKRLLTGCPGTRRALRSGKFDAAFAGGGGSGVDAVDEEEQRTEPPPQTLTLTRPAEAIFLEWVEGVTLAEWLVADSSSSPDDAGEAADPAHSYASFEDRLLTRVRLAHGLASAVASIHEAGVAHNDLRAEHVVVTTMAGRRGGDYGRRSIAKASKRASMEKKRREKGGDSALPDPLASAALSDDKDDDEGGTWKSGTKEEVERTETNGSAAQDGGAAGDHDGADDDHEDENDGDDSDEEDDDDQRRSELRVTLIGLGYSEPLSAMSQDDTGERANDDMHALSGLLTDLFRRKNWGSGDGDGLGREVVAPSVSYSSSNKNAPDFGRSFFLADKAKNYLRESTIRSITPSQLSSVQSATLSSGHSAARTFDSHPSGLSSSSDGGWGRTQSETDDDSNKVTEATQLGLPAEVGSDAMTTTAAAELSDLAYGLPRSVLRVLSDAVDSGWNSRSTAYVSAREIADDLAVMAEDPLAYLLDPVGVQTKKESFLLPPDRLFGREREIEALRAVFDRLCRRDADDIKVGGEDARTRTEMILICGRSGTGKSSLIKYMKGTFQDMAAAGGRSGTRTRTGIFALGKFDQLRGARPYSAMKSALDSVCDRILSLDADELDSVRTRIRDNLGKNIKVLTDVLPKLVRIVGRQPRGAQPSAVRGVNAKNRFEYLFRRFLSAVASPTRPLCLCLDDIQWADAASMGLVRSLVNDSSNRHLLFVGCYRDDELTEDHPVRMQLNEMEASGAGGGGGGGGDAVPTTRIVLGNMDEDAVARCVSARLRLPDRLTRSLATVVHRKTLGNAFFVTLFLAGLAEDRLLTFDAEGMRWVWDEDAAEAREVSDDVVEVMAGRIQSMPRAARGLLMAAACVGSVFQYATLQSLLSDSSAGLSVLGRRSSGGGPQGEEHEGTSAFHLGAGLVDSSNDDAALAKTLQRLLKLGLINRLSHSYAHSSSWGGGGKAYKFAHDRIQQAAYSLLSEAERAEMHYRIGKIYMAKLRLNEGGGDCDDDDDNSSLTSLGGNDRALLFAAADQLNKGVSGVVGKSGGGDGGEWEGEEAHRLDIVRLSTLAGEEAFLVGAFGPSEEYLEFALHILGGADSDDNWSEHYDLTLRLVDLLKEVKFCNRKFDMTEDLVVNCIFKRARNLDDKFNGHLCLIKCYSGQARWDDGLRTGLDLVRKLDAPLASVPSKRAFRLELFKTVMALRKKTDEDLLALPRMTDKRVLKVMKSLLSFSAIGRLLGSRYFALTIFRMVQLSLKHGLTDITAVAFALFAYSLINLGYTEKAYRFGRLALTVLDELDAEKLLPTTYTFVYAFNFHWHDPVQTVIDPLLRCYKVGLEIGDAEYASYGILHRLLIQLHCGALDISSLIEEHQQYVPTVVAAAKDMVMATYQASLNLAGDSPDPSRLNGRAMTEDDLLQRLAEKNNPISEYYFRMSAACVAYLFGDYDRAAEHCEVIEDFGTRFPAAYSSVVQAFYDGLVSFAMARKATWDNKKRYWKERGRKAIRKFQKWSKDCPSNNAHKVLLLQAENFALRGRNARGRKSKKYMKLAAAAFRKSVATARENGFVNDEAIAHERAALFYKEVVGDDDLYSKHLNLSLALYRGWGATAKVDMLKPLVLSDAAAAKTWRAGQYTAVPHAAPPDTNGAFASQDGLQQRKTWGSVTGVKAAHLVSAKNVFLRQPPGQYTSVPPTA